MANSDAGVRTASNATFIGSALLMVLSVSLFTGSHGFVRSVGKTLHPFEIAFFTSLFSFAFYLPWLLRTRFRPMLTSHFKIHVFRAFFNAAAVGTWYTALTITPLADATALALTSPLVMTLGAIVFLGERARLRRWIALGFGVAGALVIVRPGFETVSVGFLLVILSIVMGSGTRLIAKHLTRWESAGTIGAWVALLQIPITFAMAGLFLALARPFSVGAAGVPRTVRRRRPLHHDRRLFEERSQRPRAVELRPSDPRGRHFFVFSELPDFWTWIGGAIIITSTSYIARRESV